MLEKFRRLIEKFEKRYISSYNKYGVTFNQMAFVAGLVYMPSLGNFRDRGIFIVGLLIILLMMHAFQNRYLPNAAIYLQEKSPGWLTRMLPSIMSWLVAATSGLAAALLAAYLQGVFSK